MYLQIMFKKFMHQHKLPDLLFVYLRWLVLKKNQSAIFACFLFSMATAQTNNASINNKHTKSGSVCDAEYVFPSIPGLIVFGLDSTTLADLKKPLLIKDIYVDNLPVRCTNTK